LLAALVALRALGDFGTLVCLTVLIFDDLADLDIFLDLHDLDLAFLDFLVFSVFENFPFDDLRCRIIDSLQKGDEVGSSLSKDGDEVDSSVSKYSSASLIGGRVGLGVVGLALCRLPLGSAFGCRGVGA